MVTRSSTLGEQENQRDHGAHGERVASHRHLTGKTHALIGALAFLLVAAYALYTHNRPTGAEADHRERMTLFVLNEKYDLMPVAQTDLDAQPGETSPDVLFERDGRLVICTIKNGDGVGNVTAICALPVAWD